jgi:hypothetical protein
MALKNGFSHIETKLQSVKPSVLGGRKDLLFKNGYPISAQKQRIRLFFSRKTHQVSILPQSKVTKEKLECNR